MKMRGFAVSALACAGLSLLLGCSSSGATCSQISGGGGTTGTTVSNPTPTGVATGTSATTVYTVQSNTVQTSGQSTSYLTGTSDLILGFSATASGLSTNPTVTITAPQNNTVTSVATDTQGNIYAAVIPLPISTSGAAGAPQIFVYAPGANGAATPSRTITLSNLNNTNYLNAITVDSTGQIYAAYGSITTSGTIGGVAVIAAGANGNVTPTRTITGATNALLDTIYGIAVDSAGNIYVTNASSNSAFSPNIRVFSSTATGDAVATRTITGTSVQYAAGIAVDSSGNIYTDGIDSSNTYGAILVFSSTASGAATPTRTIGGSASGQTEGFGSILVDSKGVIFALGEYDLSNSSPYDIVSFAAGTNGNVAPNTLITATALTNGYTGALAIH